jgi:hypothetical protein
MTILDRHIHSNNDPHKLTAINSTQLRCWSCSMTLDLPAIAKPTAGSTSTSSQPLNLKDETACPEHVGQRASSCGPCRSERIAVKEEVEA